jgi:hypothetical protein
MIAPGRADENRDALGAICPGRVVDADRDGEVDDRDEVAMAFTRQGGRRPGCDCIGSRWT